MRSKPLNLFRRRFTKQGAAPGSFKIEKSARHRVRAYSFNADTFQEHAAPQKLSDLPEWRDENVRWWIDVAGSPDRELLDELRETFGLHALALADVVNLGQRPKLDDYGEYLFCVGRMATPAGEGFRWEQISLFVGRQFVISFQEHEDDCFDAIRDRLRNGSRKLRGECDYLGAMLLDAVVDGYFPLLEEFGERLEALETRVLQQPSSEVLAEVYQAKRELMSFRRSVWPLRDTLNHELRARHSVLRRSTRPYLRDTLDHLLQIADVVETFRELSGSFVEVYLSSLSHRTNEVMRVLTIFATIFIPLTFLAGIYGMNFQHMPELETRNGYYYFWLAAGAVTGGMLLLFHRLGWLQRPTSLVQATDSSE